MINKRSKKSSRYSNIKHFKIDTLDNMLELIWKNKIFIILFAIIGYSLGNLYNKKFVINDYQTQIVLKDPSIEIFKPYESDLKEDGKKLQSLYISKIKLYLDSKDNFKDFFTNNYKNLNSRDFLFSKTGGQNRFKLNYPLEANGAEIITKYVEYTINKSTLEFKENLIKSILNKMLEYENAYEISAIIGLEEPLATLKDSIVIDNEALFYQGKKVLGKQILHLKNKLLRVKNDQFDYDYVLDKAIPKEYATLVSNNNINEILGTVLGLICSILTIIIFPSIRKT